MAGIGKGLTKNAGTKALALLAALALWLLIPIEETSEQLVDPSIVEAQVAVEPTWSGVESSDFVIEEFKVVPASLRIVGPAYRVSLLERLETEPIDLAVVTADGAVEAAVILPDPELRFVDNPRVRVELKVKRR